MDGTSKSEAPHEEQELSYYYYLTKKWMAAVGFEPTPPKRLVP